MTTRADEPSGTTYSATQAGTNTLCDWCDRTRRPTAKHAQQRVAPSATLEPLPRGGGSCVSLPAGVASTRL